MSHQCKLSAESIAKVIALRQAGYEVPAIATRFGVCRDVIYRTLRREKSKVLSTNPQAARRLPAVRRI